MFTVENDEYELRYNYQKIEALEKAYLNGASFMNRLIANEGAFPLSVLKGLYVLGLYNKSTETNVSGKKAEEVFHELLEKNGYAALSGAALLKVQEDMGFLFQEG